MALLATPAIGAPVLTQDSSREQAKTVLNAYRRTLETRPTRYSIDADVSVKVDNGQGHTGATGYRAQCLRDGDRLDIVTTALFNFDSDTADPAKGVGRSFRCIINGYLVSYEVLRSGKGAMALFAPDGRNYLGRSLHALYGIEAFDGYASSDPAHVPDLILTSPTLHLRADERVSGHDCKVIEATSDEYGKYTLWLDPSLDYLPRRIVNDKTAQDVYCGRKLKDWKFVPRGMREAVPVLHVLYALEDADLTQVDGWMMPTQCKFTETMEFQNGRRSVKAYSCTVKKMDLHPSLDPKVAFVPQLREGAILANQTDRTQPYRWKDGKPVPKDQGGGE